MDVAPIFRHDANVEAIPILLFIAPSWIVAGLYYRFSMRPHFRSQEMVILNQNLKKIGLFWSNCDGTFRELGANAIAHDLRRAQRNFWMMTALLSLLSVLGTFILVAIAMSGHPRLERNTFASELVKDPNLSPEQVKETVAELQSLI